MFTEHTVWSMRSSLSEPNELKDLKSSKIQVFNSLKTLKTCKWWLYINIRTGKKIKFDFFKPVENHPKVPFLLKKLRKLGPSKNLKKKSTSDCVTVTATTRLRADRIDALCPFLFLLVSQKLKLIERRDRVFRERTQGTDTALEQKNLNNLITVIWASDRPTWPVTSSTAAFFAANAYARMQAIKAHQYWWTAHFESEAVVSAEFMNSGRI